MEKFEDFRDFAGSKYQITIARVQQEALKRATGPVIHPAKQLEVLNRKKEKGRKKGYPGEIISISYAICFC